MNSGYVDIDMLPGSYPHRKIFGLYGLKHKKQQMNIEDRATQPM